MKISAKWIHGVIVVLAITLFSSLEPALADTYTIYNLGYDQNASLIGITATGTVVIYNNGLCTTGDTSHCYTIDNVNGLSSFSATAPNFVYDNGGTCSSLPTGFSITNAVCNNGRIGFGESPDIVGLQRGVYLGPDSDPEFIQLGSMDGGDLNASGDFAWDNGIAYEFYEAIDTSVPEPSSLALLATGFVALMAPIRRKL